MTTPAPPTIVWFRRDLRLHDHEPLTLAAADGGSIVAVYCFDPRDDGRTHLGDFPKVGPPRARFVHESVAALRAALRARGSDLVVREGRPEDVLPAIADAIGAQRIRFHLEDATEERAVERAIAAALPDAVALAGSWGHTLVHREDLPFVIEDLPELFTRFRKAVEARAEPRPLLPTPSRLGPLPPGLDAGALPAAAGDAATTARFEGGEAAGLARLQAWVFDGDALGTYKETRNGLLRFDDSSKLSPWLAAGCLSPRQVHAAVRDYERTRGANDSTYWMRFELLWRDYFRFVLAKHGAKIFRRGGLVGANVAWRENEDLFTRWRLGQTGYPLVDAAMRELLATGYTSNRARQNVASFLTKNLGIDWRLGAVWFESQLVDYDVASNWGNWVYFAGVGNDARGYRLFDVGRQALTYDPAGDFARHWLPELAPLEGGAIHDLDAIARLGGTYPRPIVDFVASANAGRGLYAAGIEAVERLPGADVPPGDHGGRRTPSTSRE